jgi:hypothetical protein
MKIAFITGDIINSTKSSNTKWQSKLKTILQNYGKEDIDWEISRGDYFQIRIPIKKAMFVALHIKAGIKELSSELDVRMSIGIGEELKRGKKISLSLGQAQTLSGRGFDKLKKQNIIINTEDENLNEILNTMLALALIPMNKWTIIEAKTFLIKLLNKNLNLTQLSKKLKKSTSTVSETLKRAAFDEISRMEKIYQILTSKL